MSTSARGKRKPHRPAAAAASRRSAPHSAPAPPAPPLTAEESVRQAADAIIRALPQIVNAVITQASKGSYMHARFLCEFAGLSAAALSNDGGDGQPSLACLLLERLELEPPAPTAPVAGEA